MDRSVFRREVLPFLGIAAVLIAVALLADLALHRFGWVWVGRYLGISGTLLILGSFAYSLRKRKLIAIGEPRFLLGMHEVLTWFGSLMILVHAGVHFTAILPWLALAAMLINVASGMTGKFLLDRSRRHAKTREEALRIHGLPAARVEEELFWDAVAVDVMKKWRAVHFPITLAFAVLAFGHIFSVLLFWQWK